jgi:L,D-peptidoglycan transpeptidase YkuD (ErfK/YbiS/YcfS/YnhG family)
MPTRSPSKRMRGAILAVLAAGFAASARGAECPDALANTLGLVLVTTNDMRTAIAQVRRYTRASTGTPWVQEGVPEPAVVGVAGLGWGATFDSYKAGDEPVKVEGDRRTPAGVFRLGTSFGFAASSLPGHVVLQPDKSVCVDDVDSSHYNSIKSRLEAGAGTSGEEMWRIPLYRSGIFIDYPTDREKRRGSCIFVHIWRSPTTGTAGCIALPEARVKTLQAFARAGAVIAILPAGALARFKGCLPPINASAAEGSKGSEPTDKVRSPR